MPDEIEVYYFMSLWQNLDVFNYSYFLCMDPFVTDFLVKNKIPIIIDCSCELGNNYYIESRKLLDNTAILPDKNSNSPIDSSYFRNINQLEFYLVGSTEFPHDWSDQPRTVKVYHGSFPGCFFEKNTYDYDYNQRLRRNKNSIIEKIKSRRVTDETLIWQALCNQPRFTRGLFQLKVDYEERIAKCGRYSRLTPMAEEFERWYNFLTTNDRDLLPYTTRETIKTLDEIKIIDTENFSNSLNHNNFVDDFSFMTWIVLETNAMNNPMLFSNTSTMITEKSANLSYPDTHSFQLEVKKLDRHYAIMDSRNIPN